MERKMIENYFLYVIGKMKGEKYSAAIKVI